MTLVLSRRSFIAASAVAVLPARAFAAVPDALPMGGKGVIGAVHDGDTIRFKDGATDIRLVGIQAPKLPQGRRNPIAWPMADESRGALRALLENHAITLRLPTTAQDRNGRILAHLVRDDGVWIQQTMLREGWARVYTFPDNRLFAGELYAAEATARTARRGLWAHPDYALRSPDPAVLKADIGTFQIVEGVVSDAARVRGRVYLNFGADYRTDFTASIPPGANSLFTAAKLDAVKLKGRTVRVRGYIRDFNGPSIDLTHPEQIEVTG
ncbi:MAG: thermonuclease family protein [Rhodospirillaceae bacterium]